MRVPLIIRDPAARPAFGVISEPVSLVSLTPTILELLGLEPDGSAFHGASFARHLRGGPADEGNAIFFETDVPSGAPRLAASPGSSSSAASWASGSSWWRTTCREPSRYTTWPRIPKSYIIWRRAGRTSKRGCCRACASTSGGRARNPNAERAAEPTPADLEILRKLGLRFIPLLISAALFHRLLATWFDRRTCFLGTLGLFAFLPVTYLNYHRSVTDPSNLPFRSAP